jgi:hypothetical protein
MPVKPDGDLDDVTHPPGTKVLARKRDGSLSAVVLGVLASDMARQRGDHLEWHYEIERGQKRIR